MWIDVMFGVLAALAVVVGLVLLLLTPRGRQVGVLLLVVAGLLAWNLWTAGAW